jgi:hypothetical protein
MDMPVTERFLKMISHRFHNRICKVCALVAATLILPVLAQATQNGGTGASNNNQGNDNQGNITTVPDGGGGMAILITTFGAILLFSARLSSHRET